MFEWNDFLVLALITIGGALTYYYFILYAFFMSAVTVIVFALQKRIKEIIMYVLSMIVSGMVSYLIFPPMLTHILESGHSNTAVEKLSSSNFLEQIKIYYDILNNNLFGGFWGIIVLVILVFVTIIFIRTIREKKEKKRLDKIEMLRYVLVIIPILCYLLFVAKTASFNVDRYVSPIYAVLIAGTLSLIYNCIMKVVRKGKYGHIIIVVALFIMVDSSHLTCGWDYIYSSSKERLSSAEIYGANADAICVYDKSWKLNQHFTEISKCKSVTFYECDEYDGFLDACEHDYLRRELVLFLIGIDADEFIEDFLEDNPEYEVVNNERTEYGESVYLNK